MTTATPIRIAPDTIDRPARLLALALGANPWPLGFTTGAAQRPRERHVLARHMEAVRAESRQAPERFGLPAEAPGISGYEAGRDGFWLHRGCVPPGVANGGVAASSLAVNRRPRRATTARLAVQKRLTMLLRHVAGARQGWRIVRGPSVEEADRRQWPRACTTANRERTRGINRSKGWRASHGLVIPPARPSPRSWSPAACGTAPRFRRDSATVASRRGSPVWRWRSAWPRGQPNAARCSRRRRLPSRTKCHNC